MTLPAIPDAPQAPRPALATRIRRKAQRSVKRRLETLEQIVDSPLEETRDRIAAMRELVRIAALAGQNVEHVHRQDRPFEVRALVGIVHQVDGEPGQNGDAVHIELPRE